MIVQTENSVEKLRILVAEDDPDFFMLMKVRLNTLGVLSKNITNVSTVKDATATLETFEFDIILLDLGLLDSVGLDTFEKIHESNPDIPVIVLSGCQDLEISRSAVRMGAQDYIFKTDIGSADLIQKISYAIERNVLLKNLREHSSFKSRFLAQMSHEIRTPMNGVIGLTDILKKSKNLSHEELEIVDTLANCGKRLITLISDILDVSKIEAGKMEFDQRMFNIRELIDECMTVFSENASQKNLILTNLIQPDVPSFAFCDRERIGQVISNLVGNAVKFTKEGQVSIDLKFRPTGESKGYFRFEVIDTGPGIAENVRSTLFEEYQQAAFSSMESGIRGTGLGLAVCKGLVEKMGGKIGVESTLGKGSNFWFELELATKKVHQPTRTDFETKHAIIFGNSMQRSAIIKAQLALRHLESECITPEKSHKLKSLPSRDGKNQVDVAIIDTNDMTDSEVATWMEELRKAFSFQQLPVLLVSGQSTTAPSLEGEGIDKLNGILSQSKVYAKVAGLIGEKKTKEKQKQKVEVEKERLEGMRVLVVDDNDVNRKVAVKMLEILGCSSDQAADGREAVSKVQEQTFDAVLMDCRMPEMDGFEATVAIRKMSAPKGQVPIIALTANAYKEDKEKCADHGMNDFLTKPIVSKDLFTALKPFYKNADKQGLPQDIKLSGTKSNETATIPMTKENAIDTQKYQDLAVLDAATLDVLKQLNDPNEEVSFLDDLINTFVEQAPEVMEDLKTAYEEKNIKGIEHSSHKLKGFARNLGAARLTALCDDIEMNAEKVAHGPKVDLASLVFKEFETARVHLDKEWRHVAA